MVASGLVGLVYGQRFALETLSVNEQLKQQIASSQVINERTRNELTDANLKLNAQNMIVRSLRDELASVYGNNSQLQEELGFFRELMAPEDAANGIRVEDVNIRSTEDSKEYLVSVMLAQVATSHQFVAGNVDLVLVGSKTGDAEPVPAEQLVNASATLEFADVMPFKFRYFLKVSHALSVPQAFLPEEIRITVRAGKGLTAQATYPWSLEET